MGSLRDKPWYNGGLRFACTGCGQCCTGSPGYVWVTPEEIEAIAKFLNKPPETFVRKVGDRYSLLEEAASYDCVFLKGKRCSIYPVRPRQCRTYPFWPQNLESPEAWQRAAEECEGICDDAPLIPLEEIDGA